jgi:small conductance mechanosensitive channel
MKLLALPPLKNPLDQITAKLHLAANGFFLQLPNIVGGIIFLIFAYFIGKLIARLVRKAFHQRGLIDLGGVLASLAFGGVMIAAVLITSVIVFPSVKPATIISSLGLGSVALGFAFKDILQNMLAGLLLLVNRPYRRGDQIVVKGFEGTVEHIESRATLIKTYDGRRVIIPNSDVYTSPVVVNTAFSTRRDQFDIGIGYGDKPDYAMAVFAEAIANLDDVEADPAPEVFPWGLDASSVTLRARWWTRSNRNDLVRLRSRVILAIFQAAAENGIDLPFPTQQILFHDQTEDSDGDRARQREGWPTGSHPPEPRHREQPDNNSSVSDVREPAK